jgi:hypothetical protein
MPKIQLELGETHKSVLRPATLSVVKHLMELTGLPLTTPVNYPGAAESVIQSGSALGDDPLVAAPLASRNLVTIDVTEEYPENWALTTAVDTEDNVVVFLDSDLDVLIKPVYTKSEVTISMRAKFEDRPSAEKWHNQFRRATAMLRTTNIHEITYHWGMPDVASILLYQIHKCRERVAGYGDTLEEYMRAKLSAKATTLTNQAGQQALLAVSETQACVIGWFDFTDQPNKAEYSKETGTWEATFDYKFVYDKPISVHMRYPLMIHNQLISADLRSDTLPYELSRKFLTPSVQRVLFDNMVFNRFPYNHVLNGLSIPKYDEWLPSQQPFTTTMMLRIMLSVGTPPEDILNLKEMGSYVLDPLLIAYMEEEAQSNAILGESIVKVTLYAKQMPFSDAYLEITPELDVKAIEPLSLRTPYHLLISIIDDTGTLSRAARDRLMRHGALALKYFTLLDPMLPETIIWPTLTGNGFISNFDFDRIMEYLDQRRSLHYVHGRFAHRLVGNFVIDATRTL